MSQTWYRLLSAPPNHSQSVYGVYSMIGITIDVQAAVSAHSMAPVSFVQVSDVSGQTATDGSKGCSGVMPSKVFVRTQDARFGNELFGRLY